MNGRPWSSPRSITVTIPGWVEARERARLAFEALDGLRALEAADVQHLDRDVAVEHVVAGEPDRGHPAAAEEPRYAIAPGQHIPDHG